MRRADIWRRPQQLSVRRVISDGRAVSEPLAVSCCAWLLSFLDRAIGSRLKCIEIYPSFSVMDYMVSLSGCSDDGLLAGYVVSSGWTRDAR